MWGCTCRLRVPKQLKDKRTQSGSVNLLDVMRKIIYLEKKEHVPDSQDVDGLIGNVNTNTFCFTKESDFSSFRPVDALILTQSSWIVRGLLIFLKNFVVCNLGGITVRSQTAMENSALWQLRKCFPKVFRSLITAYKGSSMTVTCIHVHLITE